MRCGGLFAALLSPPDAMPLVHSHGNAPLPTACLNLPWVLPRLAVATCRLKRPPRRRQLAGKALVPPGSPASWLLPRPLLHGWTAAVRFCTRC